MFYSCESLTYLNLLNFNTLNVKNKESMLIFCYNLTYLNISNFNTRNVINICKYLKIIVVLKSFDLSNFNTKKSKINVRNFCIYIPLDLFIYKK